MQDETKSAWYPGITEKHFEYAIQDAVRTERVACELRCAKTEVLLPDHHGYTALKVQEMMMDAISERSNIELGEK